MRPDDVIQEIAQATGRTIHAARQVFDLIVKARDYHAVFLVIDGHLSLVNMPGQTEPAPDWLHGRAIDLYEDMVAMHEPFAMALRKHRR